MSLLIDKNDKIRIDFVYLKVGYKLICGIEKEDIKNFLKTEFPDKYKEIYKEDEIKKEWFEFKVPTFEDTILMSSNIILSKNIKSEPNLETNIMVSRYQKVLHLLKDWSFADDEGNKLKINEDTINRLNPYIAHIIGTTIENYVTDW